MMGQGPLQHLEEAEFELWMRASQARAECCMAAAVRQMCDERRGSGSSAGALSRSIGLRTERAALPRGHPKSLSVLASQVAQQVAAGGGNEAASLFRELCEEEEAWILSDCRQEDGLLGFAPWPAALLIPCLPVCRTLQRALCSGWGLPPMLGWSLLAAFVLDTVGPDSDREALLDLITSALTARAATCPPDSLVATQGAVARALPEGHVVTALLQRLSEKNLSPVERTARIEAMRRQEEERLKRIADEEWLDKRSLARARVEQKENLTPVGGPEIQSPSTPLAATLPLFWPVCRYRSGCGRSETWPIR